MSGMLEQTYQTTSRCMKALMFLTHSVNRMPLHFFVLSFLFGSLMFLMLDLTKCTYFLVVPDREKIQYLGSCTIVIDAMAEGLVFIFTSSFSCYFFLIYEMVQTLLAA